VVRASSEILKAIRTEVFGESQRVFGKRLPLAKETISRLELRKEGHPVTAKHLRLLRELRAPKNKADQFHALLKELEEALWRELQVSLGREPGAQEAPAAATVPTERADLDSTPVGPSSGEVPEQATPDLEQIAQRLELLRLEEARRAEAVGRFQESLQRAEAAIQRAEELRLEEEAKRAAQASRMAEEEARARARRQRSWRLGVAAFAALVVLGGLAYLSGQRRSQSSMDDARAENHAVNPEKPDGGTRSEPWEAPPPEEGTTSGGLDAGTAMMELLKSAQPMPMVGGLPRQRAAPCPEGIEEYNGFCWSRWSLTPAQVEQGTCEDPVFYEPSPGWCRTHRAGFRPWYGRRRTPNAVDP
jgi:hypothetical protein